jgi:hypothetical protein
MRGGVSQFTLMPANRSSIKALRQTRPFDDVDRVRATGRASPRHRSRQRPPGEKHLAADPRARRRWRARGHADRLGRSSSCALRILGWHRHQAGPLSPSPAGVRIAGRPSLTISIEIAPAPRRILPPRPPFRLLTQGRDSELPQLRLFPRVPPPCAQAGSASKAAKVRRIIERVAKSRDLQAEYDRRFSMALAIVGN